MKVGYARVSTADQDLALQLQALQAAGCDRIYQEHASGAARERPELAKALDCLRAGDQLVVWKLDRLGRSVRHLIDLAEQLQAQQVDLASLTESIDTRSATGRLFFVMVAAFAECERTLIVERVGEGMAAAKAQGKHTGRPPKLSPRQVTMARKLLAAGEAQNAVAAAMGVSRWTVARLVGPPASS